MTDHPHAHHHHHHHHHPERHFTGGELVRDTVLGMADGLTVPFALAAGLTGAIDSTAIIVTAGAAEIAAGSIAMGLGGYLAARSQADMRHNDCLWATGGNHWECDRRRWDDEMRARERARRTGVLAGVAAYAIVRN